MESFGRSSLRSAFMEINFAYRFNFLILDCTGKSTDITILYMWVS